MSRWYRNEHAENYISPTNGSISHYEVVAVDNLQEFNMTGRGERIETYVPNFTGQHGVYPVTVRQIRQERGIHVARISGARPPPYDSYHGPGARKMMPFR
jgi:hypothetical protein